MLLFWLLNLILLPAIAVVLWMCRKDQQERERKSYLAIAWTYLALNVLLLDVFPIVGIILEETHH